MKPVHNTVALRRMCFIINLNIIFLHIKHLLITPSYLHICLMSELENQNVNTIVVSYEQSARCNMTIQLICLVAIWVFKYAAVHES